MRIKIVPTLRYGGDHVHFASFRIEGNIIHHNEKWVDAGNRGKEVLKEGDYWLAGAEPSAAKDNQEANTPILPFCEVTLMVQDKGDVTKVYVTGACAIYEINDQGETIDKLFHA